MAVFDILDRNERVHRNVMLEASAGTGKTFAIENLVVRLLLEDSHQSEPIGLNRMLVVTFTKAATRDLKVRIRSNLEKTLFFLKRFQSLEPVKETETVPDFLIPFREEGAEVLRLAQRRIESALFIFDQSQIYTIHGFCWRMLQMFAIEGGISLNSPCSEDQTLPKTVLLNVVKDFMRTELSDGAYSSQQLYLVLQLFKGQIDELQSGLLSAVTKGLNIASYPSYRDYFEQFRAAMKDLAAHQLTSENIVADFMLHIPSYREICDRSKNVHPWIMESISYFAKLFDQSDWTRDDFDRLLRDGLLILELLAPTQLKAKGAPPLRETLHYPDFLPLITSTLSPIIDAARDPHVIFARMANDCQQMVRRFQIQEEILGFNDLLLQMQRAVSQASFVEQVRNSFDAVIVDEFQDTDPVQWGIFRQLFTGAEWPGHLYLVGDPKQSIYAFRQADIYTYLSAAELLDVDAAATLDTNYRSQPSLVQALNALFDSCRDLFPLPRQEALLPYRAVKAGKTENKHFSDQGAVLQFLLAQAPAERKRKMSQEAFENSYFLPAIAKEILRLHVDDQVSFNQCAILVADRFQAERVIDYLERAGIPTVSQRGKSLSESIAVHSMRELLQGILHYRQGSLLRIALGGLLIGMDHEAILALDDTTNEAILRQCEQLRHTLLVKGFSFFYVQFMQSCWTGNHKNILQCLLERHNGLDFYKEWQDVAEMLIDEQSANNLSAQGLIGFLDELETLALNEDERIRQTVDVEKDGVNILTSHVSKGLEFDIVFTLGLIKRPPQREILMPVERDQCVQLEAIMDKDASCYKKYCEELDAEKMRQLYVAMTRAKYRLYVPVAIDSSNSEVAYGAASPIELLLARLENSLCEDLPLKYEKLYERIHNIESKWLSDFVAKSGHDITLKVLSEDLEEIRFSVADNEPAILPSLELSVDTPSVFIQSYSSLVHGQSKSDGMEIDSTEPGHLIPHDFTSLIKNAHTLPAGSETGIMLHTILETIPFDIVKGNNGHSRVSSWIMPLVQNTSFEPWCEVLADIVYNALRTPLDQDKRPFCLADVSAKKMLREAEFLFSSEGQEFRNVPMLPGYVKGVIDLFFEHEGKYYLVDWKSNWLGASASDYVYEKLSIEMENNHYGLQAEIYIEALRKYLKLFNNSPFEELFGGVYYLFLRGVSPQTGIFCYDTFNQNL